MEELELTDFNAETETATDEGVLMEGNTNMIYSLIYWRNSNRDVSTSTKTTSKFNEEMPKTEDCDIEWINSTRKFANIVLRSFQDKKLIFTSSFQLSPSYFGSTRQLIQQESEMIYYGSDDMYFSDLFRKDKLANWNVIENSLEIDTELYASLEGIDTLPEPNERIEIPFDLKILEKKESSLCTELGIDFIVPSSLNYKPETPVTVIGYSAPPTNEYLEITYKEPPSKKELKEVFRPYQKTASFGKIKLSNSHFLLVSSATCYGMSGSAVFSLEGNLIGFLIGRTNNIAYDIVMNVHHPKFVIEYLSNPGFELLTREKSKYLPKLYTFIEKHLELIKKAINSECLNSSKRDNLKKVVEIFSINNQ